MTTNLRPGGNAGKSYPAEVLTPAEVRSLMDACRQGALGDRNRALIAVLYRAGLRVSEALALRPQDIDPAAGTIRVLRGKGGKARTVGVDDTALRFLERWLTHRVERSVSGAALFCSLDGSPLEPASVRQILRRAASRAGVVKRVHPHGLRHTMAAELAAEGVPLPIIQGQLGHSNASVTSRYINHLSPQQVVEATRGRVWADVEPKPKVRKRVLRFSKGVGKFYCPDCRGGGVRSLCDLVELEPDTLGWWCSSCDWVEDLERVA